MSRLSNKFRGDLRRRRRKLDALADVRFVTATDDADLAAEFETFLDVEASGWKGESGDRTAIRLRREGSLAVYRALLSLRGDEDHCEINALYAEGRCIASQLCMRTGGEFAALKIGYDESYSRLAPGMLLREHIVDRCCQDPDITRMNWLSESAWQRPWHPDTDHAAARLRGHGPLVRAAAHRPAAPSPWARTSPRRWGAVESDVLRDGVPSTFG